MKIGFTGTQQGMSEGQKAELERLLMQLNPQEFHHGDCIGADEEANMIAALLCIPIIIHPPLNSRKRAYCVAETILKPKDYLERNRDIVDAVDLLLVAPRINQEELRSGTWATWRYAQRIKRSCIILER